jgi:hypothetical protein
VNKSQKNGSTDMMKSEEGKSSVTQEEAGDVVKAGLKSAIANFTVHFKRPFRSADLEGEDVAIHDG